MWSNPLFRHHSPACRPQPPAPSPLFLKLHFCGFAILLVLVFLLMTPLLTQFCTHTHIGAHIGIYENSYKHTSIYTYTYIYTHVRTYHTHINKYTYIIYLHAYILTYIHIHSHTYVHSTQCTQTHIHTLLPFFGYETFSASNKTGDLQLFYLSPQNFSSMTDIFGLRGPLILLSPIRICLYFCP